MVEALTKYSKFCDNFLQHSLSPEARSSIEKQKANVMEQIRLTNDQIVHYRVCVCVYLCVYLCMYVCVICICWLYVCVHRVGVLIIRMSLIIRI